MMQRTRQITERYLSDKNSIAVVVVPANITRVRDSQAMQLVQSLGKEASALGVMAKADLAHDPRYKQRKQKNPYWELESRLRGTADDVVGLSNGWVAVKNRDTLVEEEEAGGLGASFEAEAAWFEDEAKLGDAALRSEKCGITALLKKIDVLFSAHIKTAWVPMFETHLKRETEGVETQLTVRSRVYVSP
jgi:hypothetical protein